MDTLPDAIFLGVVMMLVFLGALRFQAYLIKRAIEQVIDRFRKNQCICSRGAKTIGELGLEPPNLLERLCKPRDYKPFALRLLIREHIVLLTEDNKMCLHEKRLHIIQQKLGAQTRVNP